MMTSPDPARSDSNPSANPAQWPAIMSLHTAARYMDRSYDTVWLMVKRMEIPAVRHGTRQFLRKVDIDAWAERMLA